jgi:hypothetical protein
MNNCIPSRPTDGEATLGNALLTLLAGGAGAGAELKVSSSKPPSRSSTGAAGGFGAGAGADVGAVGLLVGGARDPWDLVGEVVVVLSSSSPASYSSKPPLRGSSLYAEELPLPPAEEL